MNAIKLKLMWKAKSRMRVSEETLGDRLRRRKDEWKGVRTRSMETTY